MAKYEKPSSALVGGSLVRRPDPPYHLHGEQAEIWREVVSSEPPDFFVTAALRNMLVDYCNHTVTARLLSVTIDNFDMGTLDDPKSVLALTYLTSMRDRETKAAADKATKLRLTNQSRYTPKAAATATSRPQTANKPWEHSTGEEAIQ